MLLHMLIHIENIWENLKRHRTENFSFYPVSVLFVGLYIISLHDIFYEGSYGLGSVKSFSHFCLQSQGWMKSVSNGGILIAL